MGAITELQTRRGTIVDVLAARAEHQPDAVAFWFVGPGGASEEAITYRQLDARAGRFAARLSALGADGERVLILLPPGLDYLAAFLGCLRAGAVAVPAYPPRAARDDRGLPRLRAIAADCAPRIAVAVKSQVDAMTLAEGAPELAGLAWLTPDDAADVDPLPPSAGPRADALAFLQYTSGSTATPKGVMVTHANLVANLAMIARGFGHHEGSVGGSWLPPYHDMGLVGGLLQPIFGNLPTVLMAPLTFLQRPMLWLEAIDRHRVTATGGPNFAYDLCVRRSTPEERAALDLSCWEVAFVGAEPVRAATLGRFAEAFAPAGFRASAFYPCYGLAEGTLIVTGGTREAAPVTTTFSRGSLASGRVVALEPGAADGQPLVGCGQPIDQRVAVVDPETGVECLPGRVGEIWVAGPNVAAGYWGQPEATAAAFGARLASGDGPYLRTGDLGFRHGGELFVSGRIKDLVIVRGRNVYPQDVEAAADGCHPALRAGAAAAFGLAGRDGREQLVVAVEVGRSFREGDADAVVAAIRQAVADATEVRADAVLLLRPGGVPKTSSGKVRRAACREAYLEEVLPLVATSVLEEAEDAAPPESRDLSGAFTRAVVVQHLREALAASLGVPLARIDPAQPLTALGFDSLAVAELQVGIRRDLGVELGLDRLIRAGSVENLADEILAALGVSDVVPAQVDVPADAVEPSAEGRRHLFDRARAFDAPRRLAEAGLRPFFREITRNDGATAEVDGRTVVMLGSNNYLGLTADPRVREAAARAAREEGPSLTGSRVANGSTLAHRDLEHRLADFLGREDALVFTTGYQANIGALSALLTDDALLLLDAHRHASIYDGALISRCRVVQVAHNDVADLEAALARAGGAPTMAMVDGVYSMGGDLAPLPELSAACRRHGAVLAVDDAHGLGMLGATGRGTEEELGALGAADVLTGTFSKSLASIGGWVAAEAAVVDWVRYNARSMLFSASMPPPALAAAATALEILIAEPWRVERLGENARYWRAGLASLGFTTGASASAIVPVIVGDDMLCLQFAEELLRAGVYVGPAVQPAVPRGMALVRSSVVATHERRHLDRALAIFGDVGRRLGIVA